MNNLLALLILASNGIGSLDLEGADLAKIITFFLNEAVDA